MRTKDELKKEAVIQSTVKLVNEIGFASSSVSKIARAAGVSPATIYVYFENKEDLLVSTYVRIKQMLGKDACRAIDANLPIGPKLERIWNAIFNFVYTYPDYFHYTEQFSNSPFADLVNKVEIDEAFAPIYKIIEEGMVKNLIKNVNMDIISAFIFYPILTLANKRLCQGFTQDEKDIEAAFSLAWDAIKL